MPRGIHAMVVVDGCTTGCIGYIHIFPRIPSCKGEKYTHSHFLLLPCSSFEQLCLYLFFQGLFDQSSNKIRRSSRTKAGQTNGSRTVSDDIRPNLDSDQIMNV